MDGMVLIFGCASDPLSPDRSDHYWHMTGNFMNNDGCPNNTMFWPLPGSRQLPVGTGFLVSGSTPYHRLAVCTHYHDHLGMRYGNVTKQRIGAVMDVVAASQSHGINAAGAFDLVKESGSIPAHSVTTLTAKHTFRKDNIKINAFASSVHTHQLGMRVRAWLTKADGRVEELDDIASNGTVAGGVRHTVIETGDTVSVSCTYNNTNSKDVIVG